MECKYYNMGKYAEAAERCDAHAKRLDSEMPKAAEIARRAAAIIRDADAKYGGA